VSRARHVDEASVMHALGARHASLRRVLRWEYRLLALVTGSFALVLGSALGAALRRWRLELDPAGLYWTGALTAFGVSAASLGAGRRCCWRRCGSPRSRHLACCHMADVRAAKIGCAAVFDAASDALLRSAQPHCIRRALLAAAR
jgi:hypothetical protein